MTEHRLRQRSRSDGPELYDQKDMTVSQIGEVLGVSRTTIYRALGKQAQPVKTRRPSGGQRRAGTAVS